MQLSHKRRAVSASFDDPNLVSAAGLVPVVALAESAGLRDLADKQLSVPADRGANAGWKVMSLVAGMVAGADSIDDMDVLRHGGMRSLFKKIYAPSTLGSFLRGFTFGHVRQLDAVASRFLGALAARTPLLVGLDEGGEYVMVDIDDTIIEVHGYTKQGSGYGYSGVRGINAAIVTVSTKQAAPVIIAQRMRKGAANSARGASRLVADALSNLKKLRSPDALGKVLLRADSAFYGYPTISVAITVGADVSVTARLDPAVKAAIGAIGQDAWEKIEYTHPVFDEDTGEWVSRARSPKYHSPHSALGRSPNKCRDASWSAGSPTSTLRQKTARPRCSTVGDSTPSSPPAAWMPWKRTRPTASTRSSSKSMPI